MTRKPTDNRTSTYDGADNAATQAVYNASAGTTNSIAYTYNAGNELTQAVSSANGTTSYAYDAAGRLASVTDNAGRQTSYAYSSMGRLTQVSAGGRSFNYTYDILGRRTQLQYPNGMTVAYAYDARGRLTDIHCRDAANVTLERYTYTFDGADNITQVVDAATAKWAYAYDDRYRLTQAERYLGATLKHRYTYTYDGADNAATQAVYNASAGTTNSIAYTYNAGNELTQAVSSANGTTSYAYDLWGRLTGITRGTQSAALGWAYQDRLKSYTTTLTGERSVNFAYTGDGRRMGVDNTLLGAKSWSYDGAWGVRTQSYASVPDSGRWYIQEPWGTVLAEAPVSGVASDLRYYVRDHLGSTRSVRRENTTKFAWLEYDPYGTTYASGGWTGFVQDRFTGHEFDMETNMYWAPYRYYRPDMLRWASRDPLGMVDGPNVYGYVGGGPTSLIDTDGQIATWAAAGIGGALLDGLTSYATCWASSGQNCARKAACSGLGGFISGSLGGITRAGYIGTRLLAHVAAGRARTLASRYGGIINGAGGVLGAMATCACNQIAGSGGLDAGNAMKCCAGSALGSLAGGAIGGALGRLQDPASAVVSRYNGSLYGDTIAAGIREFSSNNSSQSSCCD